MTEKSRYPFVVDFFPLFLRFWISSMQTHKHIRTHEYFTMPFSSRSAFRCACIDLNKYSLFHFVFSFYFYRRRHRERENKIKLSVVALVCTREIIVQIFDKLLNCRIKCGSHFMRAQKCHDFSPISFHFVNWNENQKNEKVVGIGVEQMYLSHQFKWRSLWCRESFYYYFSLFEFVAMQ